MTNQFRQIILFKFENMLTQFKIVAGTAGIIDIRNHDGVIYNSGANGFVIAFKFVT